ncbi:MAG: ABC transporter substrate-binding protein [Paracoccaceae bacterium]
MTRRAAVAAAFGCAVLTQAGGAAALSMDAAQEFVTGLITELRVLVQNNRSGADGAAEFLALLERKSALDPVGRFAMGRAWREMDETQQTAYQTAFRSYISRTYQNRFSEYAGEDITIFGATDAGQKGVLVKSHLVRPSSEPVDVEWLVDDRSGAPLLSDILFEGVSLAITLRETFGGMLEKRNGDINQFIADLGTSSGA